MRKLGGDSTLKTQYGIYICNLLILLHRTTQQHGAVRLSVVHIQIVNTVMKKGRVGRVRRRSVNKLYDFLLLFHN